MFSSSVFTCVRYIIAISIDKPWKDLIAAAVHSRVNLTAEGYVLSKVLKTDLLSLWKKGGIHRSGPKIKCFFIIPGIPWLRR